jgi:hypothetical protein
MIDARYIDSTDTDYQHDRTYVERQCERAGVPFNPADHFSAEVFDRDGRVYVTIYDLARGYKQLNFAPRDIGFFADALRAGRCSVYGLELDTEECQVVLRTVETYLRTRQQAA